MRCPLKFFFKRASERASERARAPAIPSSFPARLGGNRNGGRLRFCRVRVAKASWPIGSRPDAVVRETTIHTC